MRLDRVPLSTRVLAALRLGEMTTPELDARLGKRTGNGAVNGVLLKLMAAGVVRQTSKGREASWALADAQNAAIREKNDGQDYAGE